MNQIIITGSVPRSPRRFATRTGKEGLGFTLFNDDDGKKLYIQVTYWDVPPHVVVGQGDRIKVTGKLVNTKTNSKDGIEGWEKSISAEKIESLQSEHGSAEYQAALKSVSSEFDDIAF